MKMEEPLCAFRTDGPYSIGTILWNGYVWNQNGFLAYESELDRSRIGDDRIERGECGWVKGNETSDSVLSPKDWILHR